MPSRALHGDADARQPVDRSECEALRFTIVPSPPSEDPAAATNCLIETDAYAVLERSGPARQCDVGRCVRGGREPKCLAIVPTLIAIVISEYANGSIVPPQGIARLSFPYLPVVPEQPPVEMRTVGHRRLRNNPIPECPPLRK